MTTPVGKFDVKPDIRFISRWEVDMRQSMTFNDRAYGLITVAEGFVSDLASIRILREICRWCAVTALTGGTLVDSYPWIRAALIVIAIIALALYGLLAGWLRHASLDPARLHLHHRPVHSPPVRCHLLPSAYDRRRYRPVARRNLLDRRPTGRPLELHRYLYKR